MMIDIVKILRHCTNNIGISNLFVQQAADEIERLRAEIAALNQQDPAGQLQESAFGQGQVKMDINEILDLVQEAIESIGEFGNDVLSPRAITLVKENPEAALRLVVRITKKEMLEKIEQIATSLKQEVNT
jgi:hypothetical protein